MHVNFVIHHCFRGFKHKASSEFQFDPLGNISSQYSTTVIDSCQLVSLLKTESLWLAKRYSSYLYSRDSLTKPSCNCLVQWLVHPFGGPLRDLDKEIAIREEQKCIGIRSNAHG